MTIKLSLQKSAKEVGDPEITLKDIVTEEIAAAPGERQ